MNKKDLVRLIETHFNQNEEAFKEKAIEIAREFEQNGDEQLAHYILGLAGEAPVFIPQ